MAGKVKRMLLLSLVMLCLSTAAHASATSQVGHIVNVTYAGDTLEIQLDAGPPDNCSGALYGWMTVPSSAKAMTAFLTALWIRGDIAQVQVTVYTDALVGSSCTINQLDPAE